MSVDKHLEVNIIDHNLVSWSRCCNAEIGKEDSVQSLSRDIFADGSKTWEGIWSEPSTASAVLLLRLCPFSV